MIMSWQKRVNQMRKYYGIKAPKEEKPITEEDLKNIKEYMEEVKILAEEELSVLTDKQIQEYLKKYPQLDEADILLAEELCQRKRLDLDSFLETVAKEVAEIAEQQKD